MHITGQGWGQPPRWNIRRDLARYPMIEIRAEFGNHGYNCEWVSLIELTPRRPIERLSLTPVGYDDQGANADGNGDHVHGEILPNHINSLIIRYSGSFEGSSVYRLSKEKYISDTKELLSLCINK